MLLEDCIAQLTTSRQSICEGMVLAIELLNNCKSVVDLICGAILDCEVPEKLRALLYLVSDILYNSVKVTNAWTYKKELETQLPEIMDDINQKWSGKSHRSTGIIKSTKRLIKFWQEKNIFEGRYCQGLEATLCLCSP